MKWIRIDKVRFNGQCRHCQRTVRPGQIALVQKMPNNPPGDREMLFHKTCIAGLIAACPPDTDEQAFNDLRTRIATTGLAFPD